MLFRSRKNLGFDVSDRIVVNWNAPEELAQVISSATTEISSEVLATEMIKSDGNEKGSKELGLWLNLTKSS